jgi:hypothetical protein
MSRCSKNASDMWASCYGDAGSGSSNSNDSDVIHGRYKQVAVTSSRCGCARIVSLRIEVLLVVPMTRVGAEIVVNLEGLTGIIPGITGIISGIMGIISGIMGIISGIMRTVSGLMGIISVDILVAVSVCVTR